MTTLTTATTIALSLRTRLAPADAFEEILFDQVVCAAEEVERVRDQRPDQADPKWLRHLALAQGLFHRAHAQFLRHRKDSPATALAAAPSSPAPVPTPAPEASPLPAPPAAAPAPAASDILSGLSRRDRRRYSALLRAAPSARGRTTADATARDPDAARRPVAC